MQVLRPHLKPAEAETQRLGPDLCCTTLQVILRTLQCENPLSRRNLVACFLIDLVIAILKNIHS